MNLKDFIEDALTELIEGVKAAQANAAEHGGAVHMEGLLPGKGVGSSHQPASPNVTVVDFDIAVSIGEGSLGRAGIAVVPVIGARGEVSSTRGMESRMKFSVHVVLPKQPPLHD